MNTEPDLPADTAADDGNDNPFRVSPHCIREAAGAEPSKSPSWFVIRDGLVVCGAKVALPEVCCQTLSAEDLVPLHQTVTWPWFRLVLFQRSCRLLCYESRRRRRRRILRVTCLAGLVVLVSGAFCWLLMQGNQPFGFELLFVVSVWTINYIAWMHKPVRLRLQHYERPGIYFVTGFSEAYLNAIAPFQADVISGPSLGRRSVDPMDQVHP